MKDNNIVAALNKNIEIFNEALLEEVDKQFIAKGEIEDDAGDISSRYWLMQLLSPLNKKELKSMVDGFLVQLLNEDQAKKLVKFLVVRFPHYYTEGVDGVGLPGQTELATQAPAPAAAEPEVAPEPVAPPTV